jgi:hypothetical protein
MTLPAPIIGVSPQRCRQPRADRDQPCLVELALTDDQQTSAQIDIAEAQRKGLADTQPDPIQ